MRKLEKQRLPLIGSITAFCLLLLFVVFNIESFSGVEEKKQNPQKVLSDEEVAEAVIKSEELILTLTPELQRLNKSMGNLVFPGYQGGQLFANQFHFVDLAAGGSKTSKQVAANVEVRINNWDVEKTAQSGELKNVFLWQPFLQQVNYFEHAKFKFKKGHFIDDEFRDFEALMLFKGMARLKSGEVVAISAEQTVFWKKFTDEGEKENEKWRIYAWKTKKFTTKQSQRPLFREVLASALSDSASLARARKSIHEDLISKLLLEYRQTGKFKREMLPHKYFQFPAGTQHPAVSVVDLDQDGFDDLYATVRWGENQFYHNQGDGTFREMAAELGLNIKETNTSAAFADFDNDGDQDLFLGRYYQRSMLLMNENGKFVDRSAELIDSLLPYKVVAVSAVDYNNDGLLDVHFSTYDARIANQFYAQSKRGKTVAETHVDLLEENGSLYRRSRAAEPVI